MTSRLYRRLSRALLAAVTAAFAAPALAQPQIQPLVTTAATQPAPLPPNRLTWNSAAVPTTPGIHTLDADVWLHGRPSRLHFILRLPNNPGQPVHKLPLVINLATGDAKADPLSDAPCACLTPACPAGHTWADPGVQIVLRQLVDGVVATAGLDADRVYLTGFGPAASDTWATAAALADRLAGVAAIEGEPAADPAATVEALWHVGVYLVVPRSDREAPMLSALADRPHRDYTFRVDPAGDASAAARSVYHDPAFWGWMFAQHRSADASAPPPPKRDPQTVKLGPPAVVPTDAPAVAVSVDLHALPRAAGFSIVPATLQLNGRTLPFDFGLYLPPGYPHAVGYEGGPVPVLVNLHWREFIGGSDEQVKAECLPKLLVRTPTERRHKGERPVDPVPLTNVAPLVCIMPHCPAGCRFETPGVAEAIGQLIDQVVPALHADPDRVCLTGVSYGGSSTWVVAQQIPDRLAAVVPCDGRRTAAPAATASSLRSVGVYISAGDTDGDFTNDARVMVAALAAAGHPNVTYRELLGGNHFCFDSTYTDPAFWAWLEAQHRQPGTRRPTVAAAPVRVLLASTAAPAQVPAPTAAPAHVEKTAAPPKVDPPKPPAPPPQPKPEQPKLAPVPDGFTLDPALLPTTPGPHTVRLNTHMDGKLVRFRFWLYLPTAYGKVPQQTWPVVMSLHNRGMIGGDGNGSITAEGLPHLLTHDRLDGRWTGNLPQNPIDLPRAAPFICVAPQVPTAHDFTDPSMLTVTDQLLEAVIAHCHGDPARTYLTGFSYGASNTWLVGSALAGHFAAIAPIDGRATPDPAATVKKLAHTGVYQVIGGDDEEFMPEAKRMVAALAAGPHPDFAFHVVPGGNHFCYGSVYTDPTFWAWMFSHRRAVQAVKPADTANAAAGVTVLLDTSSLPRRAGYAVIRPTVRVDGQTLSVPVGIWLPTGYPHFAAPLPVILSLHNRYAIGMDGTKNALLGEGLPNILAYGDNNHGEHGDVPARPVNPANDVAFLGVFPQCPANHSWESAPMPEVVDKLLAAILAGYDTTVDPDRVYGTGWSYGASCTWALATAYPGRFAAIAVNDGRAMPNPAAAVAKLKDVGVYLTVGDHDGEFIDEERRMLDALTAARHPNFVQHVIAHGDHAAYMAVYDDPAFWGWLLNQRRHAAAR